jgi:anti-sigma regulatory factor (Ser/Thr protein kinase)
MSDRTFKFIIGLIGPLQDRPREARRWVLARCAELRFDCAGVDLPLLVSELVTNACVHGGDPVTLRFEISRTWARVEVEDSIPRWPNVQSPTERDPGGRGLLIVDSLSHVWGIDETAAGGKVVWAEVLMEEPGNEKLEKVGCV